MNEAEYSKLYNYSVSNPLEFWDKTAKKYLSWFQDYEAIYSGDINSFTNLNLKHNKWFINGKLNACYNCLDRHLYNKNKIAYYWHGDNPEDTQQITYQELFSKVCKFSNVLKNLNISKGDRVCIYLPQSIEAIAAILACARIGAVHTVVFAGFSANALADRILDAECKLFITTDRTYRGGKEVNLATIANETVELVKNQNNNLLSVLYVENYYSDNLFYTQSFSNLQQEFLSKYNVEYFNYNNLSITASDICEPEWLDSEDNLFILYTSGSTGKPKGVLHTVAGYLLHCIYSFQKIFHVDTNEVYWCTADVGWIAGHSYVLYGPLGNGITSVIYSGTPNYPSPSIFWQLIDKYKINVFYTAPTAIRALMNEGDSYLASSSRDSLRLLGTVGEPINPEAWQWYYQKVGKSNSPVIDTWWQTETGAAMLSPYSRLSHYKPGSAMLPFMGVNLTLLDEHNQELDGEGQGNLVVKLPWPGMMRSVYNNQSKFIDTYLKPYPGYFFTGDIAKRDADGHYWILGRSDDVINIAGHRLGTAEIESALVSHPRVAEAAVVAVEDDIKGQALVAFVSLICDNANNRDGGNFSKEFITELSSELKQHVRTIIGPIALIKTIKIAHNLPKTRSGKIMRRILKKIADGETKDLGDTTTLVNPEVIAELV